MFDKPVSNYPFLDVLWTFLWLFIWILWFWLVITVGTTLHIGQLLKIPN